MSLMVRGSSQALIGTDVLPSSSLRSKPFCLAAIFLLSVSWWVCVACLGNALAEDISGYWDRVYATQSAQPAQPAAAAPAASIPPPGPSSASRNTIQDLPGYLTFRYGLEYTKNVVSFNDRSTRTFVADGRPSLSPGDTPGTTNFPSAFDGEDDRM